MTSKDTNNVYCRSRVSWRTTLCLILFAFIVYNANLRSITSFDTNPTRYLPISILKEFDLDLDEFPFLHKYPEWWHGDKNVLPYYLQYVRGHHMSTYPVMPAILSVPVYAVPVLLGLTDGASSGIGFSRTEIVGTLLSKISASAVVALSVGVLYLTLRRLTSKRGAFWIASLYAFATSSWSVSSQGLWQSSMSQPLLALTLYFFVNAREDARKVVYGGIPLALSVACRPTNAIFAVVFFVYVLRYYRAQLRNFLLFPVILGALVLTYNFYYFGSLVGPYSNRMGQFTYPQLDALLGLLISPSRGLLVYSPFLIFASVGMALTFFHGRDHLLRHTSIASILIMFLYSSWSQWDGAFSYSYRFLVDLLPALCLSLATTWNWIVAHWWTKSLFVASAVFSVFVQLIGSFFYPCGWFETPTRANSHRERFWDWKDPEFLRCLHAGRWILKDSD